MSKALRIILILAILLSAGFFFLAFYTAREAGLGVAELGQIMQKNLEELNISPVYQEYSNVSESIPIDVAPKQNIVISDTFVDLDFQTGDALNVDFFGNVSSQLDKLISWRTSDDTLYIDFAGVFNENPSSTGLHAIVTIPDDLYTHLRVASISGDLNFQDLSLENLEVNTKSGSVSITLDRIDNLNILSQSGDIELGQGDYPALNLMTVSGNIDLQAGFLGGTAETLSGHIFGESEDFSHDLILRSMSGTIEFHHSGPDFQYMADTLSGNLYLNGENLGSEEHREDSRGKGGPLLKMSTVSGDLYLDWND